MADDYRRITIFLGRRLGLSRVWTRHGDPIRLEKRLLDDCLSKKFAAVPAVADVSQL
jgi:hypothetical protein